MRSSDAFFYHSQLNRRFYLLDTPTAPGVLQSQCIHTCHTNGRKRVRSSDAFFYHSQLNRRFYLLDTPTAPGVLQSQCIHTSHKRIYYQTTVTDDSC